MSISDQCLILALVVCVPVFVTTYTLLKLALEDFDEKNK